MLYCVPLRKMGQGHWRPWGFDIPFTCFAPGSLWCGPCRKLNFDQEREHLTRRSDLVRYPTPTQIMKCLALLGCLSLSLWMLRAPAKNKDLGFPYLPLSHVLKRTKQLDSVKSYSLSWAVMVQWGDPNGRRCLSSYLLVQMDIWFGSPKTCVKLLKEM